MNGNVQRKRIEIDNRDINHEMKSKFKKRKIIQRQKRKKKIQSLITLLFILMYSIFTISTIQNITTNSSKGVINSDILYENNIITIGENSNITFEENSFFKKYTIVLKNQINNIQDIKYSNDNNLLRITFSKDKIDNLVLDENKKGLLDELFAEDINDKIELSIKTKFSENFTYVDKLDKHNLIMLVSKLPNPYPYKVVLDPGHGGYDNGTTFDDNKLKEKDIVLKMALYAENYLKYNGCSVIFTRNTDSGMPSAANEDEDLKARISIANNTDADAFVSLHVNSNPDYSCKGIQMYYYCPNDFQKIEREELALSLQKEVPKKDGWKSLDLRQEDLYVLRNSEIPSVLIECGFIGNEEDRARLYDDNVLYNLAHNISNGILNYVNKIY